MLEHAINAMMRAPSGVMCRLRVWAFRLLGAKIGQPCWLQDVWIPRNPWQITIEKNTGLDRHVVLLAAETPERVTKITIRSGTYINRFTMIDACESVVIGKNCNIGPHCYITDHDHGTRAEALVASQPLVSVPTILGDDVWLGAGVIVLKGVTIGNGAVVGAGAVVTSDVQQGTVVAGVPSRTLGYRK